jgi:MFS family permease
MSFVFTLFGVVVGTWASRLPTVKARLGLADAQLGTALVCFAAGSVLGMLLLARLIDALGAARALSPLMLAQAIALELAALAPNLVQLCCVLAFFGAAQGTLNVTMNAVAVELQKAYHQGIMSSFHAFFSVGGLIGAAGGGLAAGAGIGIRPHFSAIVCLAFATAALSHLWRLRPDPDPGTAESAPARVEARRVRPRLSSVLLLGFFAMFAMVAEGAVGDWSTVYMHEGLGTSVAVASSAFVAFSIAMFASRAVGDRVVAALGTARFLRYSAIVAAFSLAAGVLSASPWLAIAGFAGLGLGLAGLTPQIYTISGDFAQGSAGRALSLIIAMGYVGFLVGPALIGFLSSVTSLRIALVIPSVLVLLIPVLVPALRVTLGGVSRL